MSDESVAVAYTLSTTAAIAPPFFGTLYVAIYNSTYRYTCACVCSVIAEAMLQPRMAFGCVFSRARTIILSRQQGISIAIAPWMDMEIIYEKKARATERARGLAI